MGSARNILYGLAATLLLFSGAGSWSRNPGSAGDEGWVNRIPAAVASAFSFGSEAPVAPRPSVALSPGPANEAQVREVFFSEREETACQPGNRQFRLEAVQGLHVCVVWAGLAGAYAQQGTFVSPDGQGYQKLTQGFATPRTAAAGAGGGGGGPDEGKAAGWGAEGSSAV